MADVQKASLGWIDEKLEQVKSQDRYRSLTVRESPHVAGQVQIDGQQFLDFGSNDYLGLSSHPALVDIVKSNVGYVGWGSAAREGEQRPGGRLKPLRVARIIRLRIEGM